MSHPKQAALVADIGATHARFQAAVGGVRVGEPVVFATRAHADARGLIDKAIEALNLTSVTAACIAAAGPVLDARVQVTNDALCLDQNLLQQSIGAPVYLINDFQALAMAVPALTQLACLGGDPAAAEARSVKGVIGPGSGLGMSVLVPEGDAGWRVLPSEGGHADLAPGNPLEQEVLTVLMAEHGAVCWETVLSGPGLVRLYRAVAALWGSAPADYAAPDVSRLGVDAEDPICHQTLELFFALLGAAAGNLALTVCARGGIYLAGGIVPTLVEFARQSPLRRRFEERAELSDYVAEIPLFVVLDDYPGLSGAALWLAERTGAGASV